MNIESIRIAAFLLMVCLANESVAGRQNGIVGWSAVVHRDAYMDYKSEVGQFSVVKANAHLYPRAQIASHVIVEEDAVLWNNAVVLSHAHIENNAEVGNGTTCEQYTTVGPSSVIGDDAIVKQHSVVMSHGQVGPNAVVGHFSHIGRRAVMEKYACVEQHVQVGSNVVLGAYSVVQHFVVIPSGLKIRPKQIVISAPETAVLLRALRGREYTKRFYQVVDEMVAKSDTSFARDFSRELDYALNDLNKGCRRNKDFVPHVLLLVYSYLQKMHGEEKMDKIMKPSAVVAVRNGRTRSDVNDCKNDRRYTSIFDEATQSKFLVTMALYYDFFRKERIEDEEFCSIAKQVLGKKRSVLAINEKCGGNTRVVCNGCGDVSSESSYTVSESDVTLTAV